MDETIGKSTSSVLQVLLEVQVKYDEVALFCHCGEDESVAVNKAVLND